MTILTDVPWPGKRHEHWHVVWKQPPSALSAVSHASFPV